MNHTSWPEARTRLFAAIPRKWKAASEWLTASEGEPTTRGALLRCADLDVLLWAVCTLRPYDAGLRERLVAAGERCLDLASTTWRLIPARPDGYSHGGLRLAVYLLWTIRRYGPNTSAASALSLVILCAVREGADQTACEESARGAALCGAISGDLDDGPRPLPS